MRHKIPHFLTPPEAEKIRQGIGRREFFEEDIWPITEEVLKVADVQLGHPGYGEVQRLSRGHRWHVDTGNHSHMLWCRWSAQILLSPPEDFEGGGLYFRDSEEPVDEHCALLVYSSDQEHMIKVHRGDRRVLVMFFK